MPTQAEQYRGAMLGLVYADRYWVTSDGPGPGYWWGRRAAMALCLAQSMLEAGFDPLDQMDRYFRMAREGYMAFRPMLDKVDGSIELKGLEQSVAHYERHRQLRPLDGKPCSDDELEPIARLAPVALLFRDDWGSQVAAESVLVTHSHVNSLDGARYLYALLLRTLKGDPKEEIVRPVVDDTPFSTSVADATGQLTANVDPGRSLHLVCEVFSKTSSFDEGLSRIWEQIEGLGCHRACAALYGQLAGAFYGINEVLPSPEFDRPEVEWILGLADRLLLARDRMGCSRNPRRVSATVRGMIPGVTTPPLFSVARARHEDQYGDTTRSSGWELSRLEIMPVDPGDVYDVFLAGLVRPMVRDGVLQKVRLIRPMIASADSLSEGNAAELAKLFGILPGHVVHPRTEEDGDLKRWDVDAPGQHDTVIQFPPEVAWRCMLHFDSHARVFHHFDDRVVVWADPSFSGPHTIRSIRDRVRLRHGNTDMNSKNSFYVAGQWPVFFRSGSIPRLQQCRKFLVDKLGIPQRRILSFE